MSKDTGGNEQAIASLTVRDYFAIHCDQPGEAELVRAAGLTFKNHKVWANEENTLGSFGEWYGSLSNEQRYELYAKVRYALADAMLEARK